MMLCFLNSDVVHVIPPEIRDVIKVSYYSLQEKESPTKNVLRKFQGIMRYVDGHKKISDKILNIIHSELSKHIVEYQPDFILFEQTGISMFHWRRRLGRKINAKCFLRIHDTFPLHISKKIYYSTSFKKSLLLRLQKYNVVRYEKKFIKDWDCILTHSEVEKEYYSQVSRKSLPVHVTKIGIDLDYFTLHNTPFGERNIDMIYIGSMRWKPNVDCVVWFCEYVLPLIVQQMPHFRLAIVGRNPSQRVQDLASDNVLVTGEVKDIREYAKRSKLSFMFSFSGSGIKRKIMELLAMGIPLICDRDSLQGYNENEIGGVLIADKNNIAKINESIIELLHNEQLWLESSQSAVEKARTYFDNKMIDYHFEEFMKMSG